MRERMYATIYVARMLNFLKIREDVRNMHASCLLMPLHLCITPSLIFNYSVIVFSSYKIILSHPSCNATTDGRTSTTTLEQHIPSCVWHPNPVADGATFSRIHGAVSFYLDVISETWSWPKIWHMSVCIAWMCGVKLWRCYEDELLCLCLLYEINLSNKFSLA